MSAQVTPTSPAGRRSQAYCEPCQDGVNTTTRRAQAWATTHNQTHHTETA